MTVFLQRAALIATLLVSVNCAHVPKQRIESPPSSPGAVSSSLLEPPQGRFLKRRVSLGRFSNETTYGKSVLLGGDVLSKQASDILATRLADTQKFLLLDAEGLGNGKAAVGADFQIVGSVSEFGRSTEGETGIFSKTKTQKARAAVNLRIVDARTGLVVFTTEGRGEAESTTGKVLGVGTAEGFDSTLSEKAISAAISNVVGNIIERLLDAPWRSYLLAVDGGECTIGGGKTHGVSIGDHFAVIRRGKQVENPQTGLLVELPGQRIAEVEVLSCLGTTYLNEMAQCKIVSGSLEAAPIAELVVEEIRR